MSQYKVRISGSCCRTGERGHGELVLRPFVLEISTDVPEYAIYKALRAYRENEKMLDPGIIYTDGRLSIDICRISED